jgi:hypothetical protein
MTMKDAVAYMDWKRVVPWKVLSLIAHPHSIPVPTGYGARNRDFARLLGLGSQIWVVTRIATKFSLAGRVVVEDILERDRIPRKRWPKDLAGLLVQWRFVAKGDPSRSAFFETNNAEPVLAKHGIRFARNRTIVYCDAPLEDSFAPCIAQARKTVFLSYRWREGRRFAIAVAQEFRSKGFSPWLDALAIPRYVAGREPGVTLPRLRRLIKMGIEGSRFAVVVNTETFADKGWTRMEFRHIRETGMPWFQVMRGGRERKCDEPPVYSRRPEEVVQEILKRYERR